MVDGIVVAGWKFDFQYGCTLTRLRSNGPPVRSRDYEGREDGSLKPASELS